MMNQQIATARFGEVSYSDEDLIHFSKGIPGFEKLNLFLLIGGREHEPFKFLQSVDFPPLAFPLLEPRLIVADYEFSPSEEQKRELELQDVRDALVYSIVTLSEKEQSANLFAPLVINPLNRKAAQVILLKSGYRVDEPLPGRD
jgi:flagellar assembly factor FliW